MTILGACGSYHPLHCSANTRKRWFFFSKTVSPKKPKFSILLSRGPTMPPIVAKTGKITVIHHVITIIIHPGHNHWPEMVVWAHGVHNFVPESQVMEHVYHVVHFGFVLWKVVQIAELCLYCTSDPPRMFIRGVWKWIIIHWVSFLTRDTFGVSSDNRNKYFHLMSALFWGNFGTKLWWIMSRLLKSVDRDNSSTSDNQL